MVELRSRRGESAVDGAISGAVNELMSLVPSTTLNQMSFFFLGRER